MYDIMLDQSSLFDLFLPLYIPFWLLFKSSYIAHSLNALSTGELCVFLKLNGNSDIAFHLLRSSVT